MYDGIGVGWRNRSFRPHDYVLVADAEFIVHYFDGWFSGDRNDKRGTHAMIRLAFKNGTEVLFDDGQLFPAFKDSRNGTRWFPNLPGHGPPKGHATLLQGDLTKKGEWLNKL
jgi:hypothetical protein